MPAPVIATGYFPSNPEVMKLWSIDISSIAQPHTTVTYGTLNKILWVEISLGENAHSFPFTELEPAKIATVSLVIPKLKSTNHFLITTVIAAIGATFI